MNERQVELVQNTFERAARMSAHVAATFYAELFAIDPSLRTMFKGDMIAQGHKLMNTLRFVVEGLRYPETILPAVRALGVKHVDYGVEARHYAEVGTALLRTLKHELGSDFTLEAREAWTAAYQFLSAAMIEATHNQTTRRAV